MREKKIMLVKRSSVFALMLLSALATTAYAQTTVSIEFFYIDPSQSSYVCSACPGWKDAWDKFISASNLIDKIQTDYGNQVQVELLDKTTAEGYKRFVEYELTEAQAVVINGRIKLEGAQLTEDNLKLYVDMYLRGEDPASNTVQPVSAFFAFSIGLFSGLSPCLMAMLAFILSYASGTVVNFKSGMFRVLVFGIGFISALMLLGTLLAAVLMWTPSFYVAMMWTVSALMVIVGLNLVGLLPVPSRLKALGQKLGSRARVELAQKYRATTIGLFSLGFMFYFVNLCTAPLSFTVLPTLTAPRNIYLLPLFGIGAILPFLAVGIVAGGSPALAKRIGQQHRLKIRALSGAILLAYSAWFIGFNLLSAHIALAYYLVSGFSPYLLAMFAFVLVYSASVSAGLKEGLGRVFTSALGLVTGLVLTVMSIVPMGIAFYVFLFTNIQAITFIVAAIMILTGLSLTGLLKGFIGSEPLFQRLATKQSFELLGLFSLGALAFLVTFRAFPLTRFIIGQASIDTGLLLAFNLILLVPFIVLGVISGVPSQLAHEKLGKHHGIIRALSGIILIAYAVWLLQQVI